MKARRPEGSQAIARHDMARVGAGGLPDKKEALVFQFSFMMSDSGIVNPECPAALCSDQKLIWRTWCLP